MTQCTKHPKLVSSVELMYAALPLHENNYIRFFFFGEKGHRGCRSSSTFLYHNNLRFWRDVIGYKTKELIAYGDTGG